MNNKEIWNYFNENIEYPKEISHNPIPYGTVWSYVSSTFLNGFINYVRPIYCCVIDRYTPDDEEIKYNDFNGTKKELLDLILSNKFDIHHTKLNCFQDDIIILARILTENNDLDKYMFFWFDMDCSDCCIGKFETNDSEDTVIESIKNWLNREKRENHGFTVQVNRDNGIINYHELPITFISGWVSF